MKNKKNILIFIIIIVLILLTIFIVRYNKDKKIEESLVIKDQEIDNTEEPADLFEIMEDEDKEEELEEDNTSINKPQVEDLSLLDEDFYQEYYKDTPDEIYNIVRVKVGKQYDIKEIEDKEGNIINIEDLGDYKIIINSLSNCHYCDVAMEELDEYLSNNDSKISFIRLYSKKDKEFLDEDSHRLDRLVADKDYEIEELIGYGTPNYTLVDKDNNILLYDAGVMKVEDLKLIEEEFVK